MRDRRNAPDRGRSALQRADTPRVSLADPRPWTADHLRVSHAADRDFFAAWPPLSPIDDTPAGRSVVARAIPKGVAPRLSRREFQLHVQILTLHA